MGCGQHPDKNVHISGRDQKEKGLCKALLLQHQRQVLVQIAQQLHVFNSGNVIAIWPLDGNDKITELQNHMRLEVTSVDHPVQTPAKKAPYCRFHKKVSGQILIISREGDSSRTMSSPFQCSAILKVNTFFLMFEFILSQFVPVAPPSVFRHHLK